ncbi:Man1-Src1p-C-terminal domain-containing protein [Crucibulum laeve]|uniref:Man1-Src1p-C-terminal domain-containing protein n=1 Tax=Crucibulum laeve TaxID=68775 RepID=A0A5C3MFH7_9AGAR|nr:Man1-Src1p-C-terminal domain-containing protein [Crucibulum laeve]
MSRLTSAQVIAMGDYLEPDFDPASLTVSQLLGVLGYHNIRYPTPYSKPKLVAVFNDEVKIRSAKFKKERLKKANSIASDDGITDGLTGQPLRDYSELAPRRSSRRLSHAPADDIESSPPRPDPPKRRRSSAQPSLGGPSRRAAPTQPVLAEESEPEEELPPKKVGRSKKTSEAAGTHARRISQPTDDSGWEDNNIFQSGAESSSPARPSPVRPKAARKSVGPRKSRKSMSAPPQMNESSPTRPTQNLGPTLQSPSHALTFKPVLPFIASSEMHLSSPKAQASSTHTAGQLTGNLTPSKSEEDVNENPFIDVPDLPEDVGEGLEDIEEEQPTEDDEQTKAITRRIAESALAVQQSRSAPSSTAASTIWRAFVVLILMSLLYTGYEYKQESATIGYCDTGSNTNSVLEDIRARRIAAESCNRENRTLLHPASEEPCPLPPLLPLPHPNACTPCPQNAICSQLNVICNNGYILQQRSPLRYLLNASASPTPLGWQLISQLNGLPLLGSVAFPPKCVEDPMRKRNIGVLGKAIEARLGQERGRRACVGGKQLEEQVPEEHGGSAKKWGIEVQKLRTDMKKKATPRLLEHFDDTFDEAIQQLVQWGGVIVGEDREGHRYLAHTTPDFTWDCALTVKSREIWGEWRTTVLGTIVAILMGFAAKFQLAQKRVESKRVAELVQIALGTLRNQEIAHYTDPVTAPQPYLSSLQLRDLILQDEHSIPTRRRLWDQVERIVEGNANVRANLEEIEGGDEMRVWRWVGSAGRGVRKELE